MKYVCSVNEFLKCYFDQKFNYTLDKLDFAHDANLDYLLWDELKNFCNDNLQNDAELYALLSDMHRFGKGVDKNENVADVLLMQGVKRRSLFCKNKLANQMIDKGLVTFDFGNAFFLLSECEKAGFLPAINNLAWMYIKGCGIKKDRQKAIDLYKQAMDGGSVFATYNYGLCLVEDDNQDGIRFIKKAAEAGYCVAQNYLGKWHYDQNQYAQAYEWFKKSAIGGNAHAFKNLGEMYHDGNGVQQNDDMAVFCFHQSVLHGNDNAKRHIARVLCKEEQIFDDVFDAKSNLPDDYVSDDE